MESLTFAGDKVKAAIPKTLYQAIIRIQAEKDVDFEEACEIAGKLVDPRRKDFEKAVEDKAERLGKSRFMKQVNAARKTIGDKKYYDGVDDGYAQKELEFTIPCDICDEGMTLSDEMWEDAKEFLKRKRWGHAKCHEQNN